ncbi:hypothetical protein TIFTF001_021660 [Ficus carica]|uniref:Uncharacterized protein n=1 Tax=Ficus carica TaxID=3494 RepID=A0AA88AHV8_FICCA|nr:hypothetical protein TIFTF001_021660 [Ficus carica]
MPDLSSSSEGGDTVAWEITPLCVPERGQCRNEFAISKTTNPRGLLGAHHDSDGNVDWSTLASKLMTLRSKIVIVPLLGGCDDDASNSSWHNYESDEALRSSEHGVDDWVCEGR